MSDPAHNGVPTNRLSVVWDFDGTLVDSRHKNLLVTRAIIEEATGKPWTSFEALRTLSQYEESHRRVSNWRAFYRNAFGMSEEDVSRVGSWWSDFQLTDNTVPPPLDGVPGALEALSDIPHGIVSMNGKINIADILMSIGLGKHFDSIVGYEEVEMTDQKPSPTGLLKCIGELTDFAPGVTFFVGDHVTDAVCVVRAQEEVKKRGLDIEVLSIRAAYGPGAIGDWKTAPDYVALRADDIVDIVNDYSGR
jgi:N-acetyl-D-muramate 6-phosphate phosphatase